MSHEPVSCFTDAQGHVYIDGRAEPRLRVIGWFHPIGCARFTFPEVEVGVNICECDGKVLIGWEAQWPLPERKPSQGLVIDLGPHGDGTLGSGGAG